MGLAPFFDRISAGRLKVVDGEPVVASHQAYKQVPIVRWVMGTLYMTESALIWIPEWYAWPARTWRAARSDIRGVDVTKGLFPGTFRQLRGRTNKEDRTFLLDRMLWSYKAGDRAEKWQKMISEWAKISI